MTFPDLLPADGRHALRFVRDLRHDPAKVWRALTDPQHLSAWYPFRLRSIDPVVGGRMEFDDGEGGTMVATVVTWAPITQFAFSEHAPDSMPRETDDLVSFEIAPTDTGSQLTFIHVFDDRQAAASYATGWEGCLAALDQTIDGHPIDEPGHWIERYEAHHARMGLDRGKEDGGSLSFDRQLMRQPRTKGWAVIVGNLTVGALAPAWLAPGYDEPGTISGIEPAFAMTVTWRDGRSAEWTFADGPGGLRLGLQVRSAHANEEEWRAVVEAMVHRVIGAEVE